MPNDENDEFDCWFPLFTNAVIAHGFPIAPRANNEKGLDISFDVMIALSGVQYSATFEGGTILKGFSSMLYPTVSYDGSIQWHFRYSHTGDQLNYSEMQDKKRVLVSEKDMREKRAFLGWCERAEIHLGTRGTNYSELKYSSALELSSHMTWSGLTPSITAGISNICGGLTIHLKFGARDGNVHFSRKGSLQKIIWWAEKTPVIMYEPREKRGWLVPASGVILHMFHTRLAKVPFKRRGLSIDSTYADPSQHGSAAARVALGSLVSPEPTLLTPTSKESNGKAALTSLGEIILEIWGILEICLNDTQERNKAPAKVIRKPGTMLQGYEYMDIVEEDSSIRLKEKIIDKTHGGWVDLAKDINCLVLFGCGFKDIIKPAPGSIPCQSWKKLPEKNDYLAASAVIIQHLLERAGSPSTQRNLTTKSDPVQWRVPQGSKLFESCDHTRELPCRCKRLQRLVRQRPFGTASPPGRLEIEGAILIGAPATKLIRGRKRSSLKLPDSFNIASSPQSGDEDPPTFTPILKSSSSSAATSIDEESNSSHYMSLESEKHAGHESGPENTAPTEPLTDLYSLKCDDTPPKEKPPIVLFSHNRMSQSNLWDMYSLQAKRNDDDGLHWREG